MDSKHSTTKHLRKMLAIIYDVNIARNILFKEQQILPVLHAFDQIIGYYVAYYDIMRSLYSLSGCVILRLKKSDKDFSLT